VSVSQRARGRQAASSHVTEIRRLRALVAGLAARADAAEADRDRVRGQLSALLDATSYDYAAYWRSLAAELAGRAAAAGWEAGVRRGRELEGAERDAAWNRIAAPIARGGTAYAEMEVRRWGPGGRARFGDAQPGDFAGFRDAEPGSGRAAAAVTEPAPAGGAQ
jgi:hypothetical protein